MLPTEYIPSNKSLRKLIGAIFLVSMLYHAPIHAQSKEQWKRIRTSHYDILFLDEMRREAQRIANTLEALYLPTSQSLKFPPKRIPIILNSTAATSNGVISILPLRRGVFYNFPPQDSTYLVNNGWFNLLAIHELRHVAQFEYYLFPYTSLTIPEYAWLLEGDAVGIETALSPGGRGRSPYFSLLYKVNLLERGGFGYYKQMFRSFKHSIPDHYTLGYYLTTYLRRQYGADIISQLLHRDGFWERMSVSTFHERLKKLTDKTIQQVYQDANEELKKLWEQQLQDLPITPHQSISTRTSKDYIDYAYPQFTTTGEVVILQAGIGTRARFVKIDKEGHEQILCTPATLDPTNKFSMAKDKLVWIEQLPSALSSHEKQRHTSILSYNLRTQQFTTVAQQERYNSVDISPDGTQLVATVTDETYNHWVRILDAATGTLLYQFRNPENNYYLTPKWSVDGKSIVAVKHVKNQATITYLDPQQGTTQDLLPYTLEAIGNPILHGSYVYYQSPYNGIDNIYVVNLQTKQRFQVTSSKYGAYHPSISTDGKWLLYNDFSKDGMDAVKIPLNPQQWTPITKVQDRSIRYYQPLVTQENNADILTKVPAQTYPVEAYTTWKKLIDMKLNFYTLPNYYPNLAAGLVLRDLLDQVEWVMAGMSIRPWFYFNVGKKSIVGDFQGRLFSSFTYKAYNPIITFNASLLPNLITQKNKKIISLTKELSLSLTAPFIWTEGEYTYGLTLQTMSTARSNTIFPTWWRTQSHDATLKRRSSKSARDIRSPWGQDIRVSYTHTPYGGPSTQAFGTQLNFYLPSLFQHHSIRLGCTYQYKPGTPHFAQDLMLESRDRSTYDIDQPINYSIDYAFPIAYPDWNPFGDLLVQRLRANIFYDWVHDHQFQNHHHAIGIDFTMDVSNVAITWSFMYKIPGNQLSVYNRFVHIE